MCKNIFRNSLFPALNIFDENGASYCRFSGFLSHNIEISGKENILGTSLGKSKTDHVAKKYNFIILCSE